MKKIKKLTFYLLAASLLAGLFVVSCQKKSDDQVLPTNSGEIKAGSAVTFYLTNKDGSKKFAQQTSLNWTTTSNSYPSITVNTGTKYQTIDGFGFTLTQASLKLLAECQPVHRVPY